MAAGYSPVLKRATLRKLWAGLSGRRHSLVPDAAAEGVVSQPLGALRDRIVQPSLERLDQARIEGAAAILKQRAEGDVERQRVLEGVLEDGKEARLVQELAGLEIVQAPAELVLRDVGDGSEQGHRQVFADDGRALQHAPVRRLEPIDARAEKGLDRGRDLERLRRARHAVGAALAREAARFDEVTDAFFQEERIPVGALDEPGAELRHARVVSQEALQELSGHPLRQWVDRDLRVVALAAPPVLVLGTVRDEQQDARGRQTLDERVEDDLHLRIDPMQILDHDAERPAPALAPDQPADGIDRAPPPLPPAAAVPGRGFARH